MRTRPRTFLALLLPLALALFGCDSRDVTDAGTSRDSGPIDSGMAGMDSGVMDSGPSSDAGAECNIENFAVEFELAELEWGVGYFVYSGDSGDVDPIDTIYIEIYTDLVTLEPMTWEFTNENYMDCELCLTIEANCTAGVCAQTFLARSGTLTITAADGVQDGAFTATIRNLVLDEVTIGDMNLSTPVTGGDVWCIDPLDIDTTIDDVTD